MILEKEERERFIKKNLGLVHSCARRFIGKGIEYDDLFSAGCVGIVKAFDAFDSERGVKFSTYAVPVILGEIKRLFRDGGTIKISRSLKELYLKINKKKEELALKNGKEPTIGEIAESLNITLEQVTEAICASTPTISLTTTKKDSNEQEDSTQIDVKCEEDGLKLIDKIAIKDALKKLSKKDQCIIFMRYFSGNTQSETAKRLKMTQVQVSRREKKILAMLKNNLN